MEPAGLHDSMVPHSMPKIYREEVLQSKYDSINLLCSIILQAFQGRTDLAIWAGKQLL